jgi:hypothetical protein
MDKPDRQCIHYTELTELPEEHELYQEWKTYLRELPRLLAEGHEGKSVLIKGDDIIGVFATHREAMAAGYDRYLRKGFMVQTVQEWEPLYRLPWCV